MKHEEGLENWCPVEFCLAPPGEPCEGVSGRVTLGTPHRERVDPEYAARIAKIMAEMPPMELRVYRRVDE